jgi:hypothetical protein
LAAVRLPRRHPEFVLRSVAALSEDRRCQLRHAVGVDDRQPQHQSFDGGKGEVASFEVCRHASETAMAAINDLGALKTVGALQNVSDFIG